MNALQIKAKNFSESSENRIHSDEIAQKFGFKGALVPGVAVYGYLVQPLVETLGKDWLASGSDSLRLLKPTYDGEVVDLKLREAEEGYTVECFNQSEELLAVLNSAERQAPPAHLELLAGDDIKSADRVEIAWDTVHDRQRFATWQFEISAEENARYTMEAIDASPLYQEWAHPHLLLSLANTSLTREYVMPTWIHVGSETTHRAPLAVGDTIDIKTAVVDKWQKKGHEFIRTWVTYWREDELTTDILHTAIFKVAA